MIFKKGIEKHVLALFFVSLGGWLMHIRVHPFVENPPNYVPFIFGILSVFIVPILFNFKNTYLIAYLLNGFSAVIGTVLMTAFSLSGLPDPLTFFDLIFRTTFAVILLLFSKLFIGQMILHHYHPTGLGRMFTAWWWTRHFIYFSIVFSIGHWLLR